MEDEAVSLWNTKAEELTVGETVKVAIVITVVTTVAMFGIVAAAGGVATLSEKWQKRKQRKLEVVNQEG